MQYCTHRYIHIGESHRGYLGTGSVDFPALFRALAAAGYQGPLTFESFSSAVVSPSLSNTLCVWRNLCAPPARLHQAPMLWVQELWEKNRVHSTRARLRVVLIIRNLRVHGQQGPHASVLYIPLNGVTHCLHQHLPAQACSPGLCVGRNLGEAHARLYHASYLALTHEPCCTYLVYACRWEDPQDLAGKARSYIDVNWGAAHRLHHAAHGQ